MIAIYLKRQMQFAISTIHTVGSGYPFMAVNCSFFCKMYKWSISELLRKNFMDTFCNIKDSSTSLNQEKILHW